MSECYTRYYIVKNDIVSGRNHCLLIIMRALKSINHIMTLLVSFRGFSLVQILQTLFCEALFRPLIVAAMTMESSLFRVFSSYGRLLNV